MCSTLAWPASAAPSFWRALLFCRGWEAKGAIPQTQRQPVPVQDVTHIPSGICHRDTEVGTDLRGWEAGA